MVVLVGVGQRRGAGDLCGQGSAAAGGPAVFVVTVLGAISVVVHVVIAGVGRLDTGSIGSTVAVLAVLQAVAVIVAAVTAVLGAGAVAVRVLAVDELVAVLVQLVGAVLRRSRMHAVVIVVAVVDLPRVIVLGTARLLVAGVAIFVDVHGHRVRVRVADVGILVVDEAVAVVVDAVTDLGGTGPDRSVAVVAVGVIGDMGRRR